MTPLTNAEKQAAWRKRREERLAQQAKACLELELEVKRLRRKLTKLTKPAPKPIDD